MPNGNGDFSPFDLLDHSNWTQALLKPWATTAAPASAIMPSSRINLSITALKFFVLPAVLVGFLFRTGFAASWLESALLYLATSSVLIYTSAGFKQWQIGRYAHRMGAVPVPRVRGKLPGNVDILRTSLARFMGETPGTYWMELMEKYGTATLDLGFFGETTLFSTDPAVVKHLLTGTTFFNYEKGEFFNGVFDDFLGSGIFNSDREMWKGHRAMTRPYFATEKISDFHTFAKHADHLITVLDRLAASPTPSLANKHGAVDVQELFGRFTLDSATEFLMGGSISSIDDIDSTLTTKKGNSSSFLDAFNAVQHNCFRRSRLGDLWPLAELTENKNTAPMHAINGVVDGMIERALAKPRTVGQDGEDHGCLLDSLIQETRDPKVLKDQFLNILLAARDTTMSTLSSAIYVLARNPAILARLRSEILSAVGTATPTYEDARGIKYLRSFLNEVLRLFPPVPFNMRASVKEDVIVCEGKPLYIPAGTRVSWSIFNLQRREALWGPDAKTFDPDRWTDERAKYLKANPFIFTPFSAGPRICLGQNFAYNEASFALIRMLQTYDTIALAPDVQPPESMFNGDEVLLISQITIMFSGGLWARFGRASM